MFNKGFIVWLCGQVGYMDAYKHVNNWAVFTQYPHKTKAWDILKSYTLFCTSFYTLDYTHICAQLSSVRFSFCTVYTTPTITTTLNN